ncbi:MAG: sigma-70 family RNA polymerase sigma factor [Deltaproteobacteria bacterium]|nr:sigma-70 family RNA polymerase sigma factor [Deltaproteobacteria bacterium]
MGEELDAKLRSLFARARAAWPGIELDEVRFIEHLAQKLSPGDDPESLQVEHLYLACACLHQTPAALEALDREFLSKVRVTLMRSNLQGHTDDVQQILRQKLLVPREGKPARIADYSGRGSLVPWIRTAAVRAAQDLDRQGKEQVEEPDETLAELPSPALNAEMAFAKARFGRDFKAAFQEAMASLDPKDRSLLRLQYIDGLTPDEIGRIYKTHRVTVWRWLSRCREELAEKTRALLAERLALSESEFGNLMELVHSQLDVSITRLLKK